MENRIDRFAAAHLSLSIKASIATALAADVEAALQLEAVSGVVQHIVIEGAP
jgi:hypothetical protein